MTSLAQSSARQASPERSSPDIFELSVVIPCLNEADTLALCITKARRALEENDILGEILVADNGSIDGSQRIATELGATVIDVQQRGYGNALRGGVASSRGKYILMGDADDSYDFAEIPRFLEKLRHGHELVQGCRLPAGGGTIMPGAMPLLHRWWGNPLFTKIARWWFQAPVNDVYCGMRGFTRELVDRLDLRSTGMEFAIEMIIKASRNQVAIVEVPITLHRDGREAHRPHLRTFRDGWRTLRFFLTYSPRWLFLEPGKLLILLGILGYAVALPGFTIGGIHFGLNTLVFASLAILCGYQCIFFAIATKAVVISAGLLPPDMRLERLFAHVTVERGLAVGTGLLLAGLLFLSVVVRAWWASGFGNLNYDLSMRWVVPGATLTAIGLQTIFSGFFLSVIALMGPPRAPSSATKSTSSSS